MSAHVVFEAIDATAPATLSRAVLHGLLRQQLGYRGVLWSDDLEMKAISGRYGVGEAAVLAIEAGCDSLLVCADAEHTLAAHAALVARAQDDAAFSVRLREAALRSLATRLEYRPAACDPAVAAERLLAEGPGELEECIARAVRP
jgi:beta-N-acetylhexosaminidase